MPRIACLRIPRFQIVVQQKHEESAQPLALISGKLSTNGYSRARIFMCSEKAQKYGVKFGMRLSQAKAQCVDLLLREQDEVLYKTVQAKLTADLISCSPKVTAREMGIFLLDASGLSLRGGESGFSHQVLKTCSKAGFINAYIGIADSAFTATVASHSSRRINIIPKDTDAQFLAPLSIKFLKLPLEIEDALFTLGIKTMGQLANLPITALNQRFGKMNEIVWKPWELSQGKDNCQPTLPEIEKIFECQLDLGGAISTFNEIIFALKSMLDRLCSELKQNGLWAQEFVLSLYHESNKFDERVLQLIRPTNEAKFLLEIIRLSLANKPLTHELTGIEIKISRSTKEDWDQVVLPDIGQINTTKEKTNRKHKNKPKNKGKLSPVEMLLLQRFDARLGKNKIFKAQASDQYLAEDAGAWVSVTDNSMQQSVLPLDLKYLKNKAPNIMPTDLILKQIRSRPEVLVQLYNSKPAAISYRKQWYKVKAVTKPEYLFDKDYYKALVEPLRSNSKDERENCLILMLLAHHKFKKSWHIEGIYD